MSAEHESGDAASGAGGTQTLRQRLERFGDPHETWQWETGEVDYIAQLRLTAADVPELLAIARQWAEPRDWPEDEKDVSGYAPIHAWRGLAQLGAAEAVGPLVEMMDLLDADGDDWFLEEFPHAFAWIGPASMIPLRDCLADDRHGVYARVCAAGGLRELAARHGQVRDDVVRILAEALSRFGQTDETVNGFIVHGLLELKATEAAEVIERAHAADRVDLSVCGNWDCVRKELGVPGLGLVPEELATQEWFWVPEAKAEEDDDEVLLPDGSPLPAGDLAEDPVLPLRPARTAGRNDPCPCGSGKKYKKCCWRRDTSGMDDGGGMPDGTEGGAHVPET